MDHSQTAQSPKRRQGESGAAMLVVLSLLLALLAGGSTMLLLQMNSTRTVAIVRASKAALYCAEAGLAASSDIIINASDQWDMLIDSSTTNNPTWYPITGDMDGDNVDDYIVTVKDDDDEAGTNIPGSDSNNRIFIVSRCTKYPESPREMVQLVQYGSGGHVYADQSGFGSGNTGNRNE